MWEREYSFKTDLTPAQIWAVWSDVEKWSKWDSAVQSCTLNEPFKQGAQFRLKPTSGPESMVIISECVENKKFVCASKLPGATLEFVHTIDQIDAKNICVTHKIYMSGPMAFMFSRLIGTKLEKHLPDAMHKMLEYALAQTQANAC